MNSFFVDWSKRDSEDQQWFSLPHYRGNKSLLLCSRLTQLCPLSSVPVGYKLPRIGDFSSFFYGMQEGGTAQYDTTSRTKTQEGAAAWVLEVMACVHPWRNANKQQKKISFYDGFCKCQVYIIHPFIHNSWTSWAQALPRVSSLPAVTRWRQGDMVEKSPIHCKFTKRKKTFTLTYTPRVSNSPHTHVFKLWELLKEPTQLQLSIIKSIHNYNIVKLVVVGQCV